VARSDGGGKMIATASPYVRPSLFDSPEQRDKINLEKFMLYSDRYVHNYPSCSRTYVTLCIYHETADPQIISDILNLEPDRLVNNGDLISAGKIAKKAGWFLGTQDICVSNDFRAHADWLLDKLSNKKNELHTLIKTGYEVIFFCFWASKSGNGGPVLDHEFVKRLSEFPIDLEFDIWFDM
jgi:hypothetical protein